MNGWKKVKLEEVTSKLGDGLHGTPCYDDSGEYFFVNGSNLKDGKIIIKKDTKRISHKEHDRIHKELNNRTILVAINGTLGNVGLYNGEKIALGKSACYFHVNTDVNKSFIRYVIEHSDFQGYAHQFATGATIKNLSLRAMREYTFLLPPLNTQNKIASTIGAYDLLIKNSQKRIKILEEMAQRLYEEWFVKFKFPGYEKVKMVDSGTEYGEIPEGWEVENLGNLTSYLSRGMSPKYDENGFSSVINQRCIRNNIIEMSIARKQSKNISNDKQVKFGDILINSTGVGTLGRVVQIYENYLNTTVDTHVTILRPKNDLYIDYLGTVVWFLQKQFVRLGAGATGQKELRRADIENIKIIRPEVHLLKKYSELVRPLRLQKINLLRSLKKLAPIRDLLIENLITGKRELKN